MPSRAVRDELGEFERGYPRLTLSFLIDVAGACLNHAERPPKEARGKSAEAEGAREYKLYNAALKTDAAKAELTKLLHSSNLPGNAISWRALLGRLWRLQRLRVFANADTDAKPMNYKDLLKPGQVSVVDLSDTGMSELNNLVIADMLYGVQEAQDDAYTEFERRKAADPTAAPPTRVLVVIEGFGLGVTSENIV